MEEEDVLSTGGERGVSVRWLTLSGNDAWGTGDPFFDVSAVLVLEAVPLHYHTLRFSLMHVGNVARVGTLALSSPPRSNVGAGVWCEVNDEWDTPLMRRSIPSDLPLPVPLCELHRTHTEDEGSGWALRNPRKPEEMEQPQCLPSSPVLSGLLSPVSMSSFQPLLGNPSSLLLDASSPGASPPGARVWSEGTSERYPAAAEPIPAAATASQSPVARAAAVLLPADSDSSGIDSDESGSP
eukprot:Hpha_TRINITY_DN16196_c2_g1::TRINITY_DN16196_c2_g1_i1::g.8048::m.8048